MKLILPNLGNLTFASVCFKWDPYIAEMCLYNPYERLAVKTQVGAYSTHVGV